MNRYYSFFVLLGVATLVALGYAFWREANPEWLKYQKAYYREQYEEAKSRYEQAANERERAKWKKRRNAFKEPKYEIKQILLQDGKDADRCITCHLDQSTLMKRHPRRDEFPFQKFGCTVCHGGDGRATTIRKAHAGIRMERMANLEKYLSVREPSDRSAKDLDLINYWTTGEKIGYMGSKECLKCHISRNPRHVERWMKTKFKSFDRIEEKINDLEAKGIKTDKRKCFSCHTTGHDPKEGSFQEKSVTCEACHGPGQIFHFMMSSGKASEGAKLAKANVTETDVNRVCGRCHAPSRHDTFLGKDGPQELISEKIKDGEAIDLDGIGDESAWKEAVAVRMMTWDGEKKTKGPDVILKSLYDDERIYFLASWPDKEPQKASQMWEFNGRRWKKTFANPDGLGMMWNIKDSIHDFNSGGCAVLCHSSGRFKEKPRMVVHTEGSLGDQWYWNATFSEFGSQWNDGYIDNQLVDGNMEAMMVAQLERTERPMGAEKSEERGRVALWFDEEEGEHNKPVSEDHHHGEGTESHDHEPKRDEEGGVSLWFDEKEDHHEKSEKDGHPHEAARETHEHSTSKDEESEVTLWFDEDKETTGAEGHAHGHDAGGGHDDHGGAHDHGGLAIAHKNDQSGESFETLMGGTQFIPNAIRINGKELPQYMPKNGSNDVGILLKDHAVEIDWEKTSFQPGTKLPGLILAKMEAEDTGDIKGKGVWKNGRWTVEFSRKLVTKSPKDIQFSDLSKTYAFGVAIWDNTHGHDHVWNTMNKLKFHLPPGIKDLRAELRKTEK